MAEKDLQIAELREIGEVLSLVWSDEDRVRYADILAAFATEKRRLDTLRRYEKSRTQRIRKPLSLLQASLTEVKKKIGITRADIEPSNQKDMLAEREWIVRGRIGVMLTDPKLKLPFYLSWLRKYGSSEHPAIVPLVAQRKALEEQLSSNTYNQAIEQLQLKLAPRIQSTTTNVDALATQINAFCEVRAAQDLDLATFYVQRRPTRAPFVAEYYSGLNAFKYDQLGSFPNFIDRLKEQSRENSISQRRLRSHFGEFLDYPACPINQEALPESGQARWSSYVGYNLQLNWAKQGLIPMPNMPKVLTSDI